MNPKPPRDGARVEIQQCGKFLEDDRFKAIRATAYKPYEEVSWPPKQEMIPQEKFLRLTASMDSIFFLRDRFELMVDVRGFSPEEIQCVLTPDLVELTAKKQERQSSQGFREENTQNATRRYQLPQKINPYESVCYLSSDGVLAVTAPWTT